MLCGANTKLPSDAKSTPSPLKAHIVATLPDGLIGLDNKLPWAFCKPDMEFFKRKTMNHVVVMGYNTVMSLPSKLEGRHVVGIFSPDRPMADATDGFYTKADHALIGVRGVLDDVPIPEGFNDELIFVAGGGMLYQQTFSEVDIIFRNVLHHPIRPNIEYGVEHYYPVNSLKDYFHCIHKYWHGTPGNTHGSFSMCEEIWVRRK